jgi:hypothetical protein
LYNGDIICKKEYTPTKTMAPRSAALEFVINIPNAQNRVKRILPSVLDLCVFIVLIINPADVTIPSVFGLRNRLVTTLTVGPPGHRGDFSTVPPERGGMYGVISPNFGIKRVGSDSRISRTANFLTVSVKQRTDIN